MKSFVNAVSSPLNISHKNIHSRTIINFHKYGNIGIIDLDIDITSKNKTGVSYDQVTTIYVVVYGVSGHQNNVDSGIWDRVYLIQNEVLRFEAGINMNKYDIINVHNLSINNLLNMNNREIKDLGDGNENSDAVNVKQLNEIESNIAKYLRAEIAKADANLKKHFNN